MHTHRSSRLGQHPQHGSSRDGAFSHHLNCLKWIPILVLAGGWCLWGAVCCGAKLGMEQRIPDFLSSLLFQALQVMEKQKLDWDPENFDIVWEIDPKYLPLGLSFSLSQRSGSS